MSSIIKVDNIQEKTSANGVDIDGFKVKDGAILTATGVPIQVVTYQNPITTAVDITSTSWTSITHDGTNRLEIKITPKQADSKIILISSVHVYHEYANQTAFVRCLRDISGGTSDQIVQAWYHRSENQPDGYNVDIYTPYNFIDTPNTTSEVTYHFQGYVSSTSAEFAWNAAGSTRNQMFTLWEIGV
tara:strand:- start:3144 stop:3704 length:561 start_codon:yes stop_codon:yes gene_type:complete